MHCDYVRRKRKAAKFLRAFKADLEMSRKNVTHLGSKPMPREFAMWLHFHKLKVDCHNISKDKKLYKTKRMVSKTPSAYDLPKET